MLFFDGKFYIRKTGTAMGTKVAPTYATLAIGYLEEQLLEKLDRKYGSEISGHFREKRMRFLDDCFILWNSTVPVDKLWEELNSTHPKIQFTMECSDTQLPFLDVLVKLYDGRISTDIYFKSTDTHLYLNFKSCHPKHTKVNIPFCLASRVVTIVSDKSQQRDRLDQIKSFLRKHNYPETLIENGIDRAIKKGPITGGGKPKNKENVIPLVTTFNPCNTNVLPFIRGCEKVLQKSDRMKDILNKSSIINSKRQPKNLKRILTSSKFDYISSETKVSKGGDKRCKTCPD